MPEENGANDSRKKKILFNQVKFMPLAKGKINLLVCRDGQSLKTHVPENHFVLPDCFIPKNYVGSMGTH